MKSLYFDCMSGASGDMIIASLLDCGLKLSELKKELAKLNISGYSLKSSTTMRGAIKAKRFHVTVSAPTLSSAKYKKRRFASVSAIYKTIEKSALSKRVKGQATVVFQALATVEAQVHAQDPASVHLHEVSDLDSVVDIIGALVGFELLGVEQIYYSVVPLGTGVVKTKGGLLPLPSPATCALLKGKRVIFTNTPRELTTPTAAALFSTLGEQRTDDAPVDIVSIGYGAGTHQGDIIPNVLRVFCCATDTSSANQVVILETNLDDMIPAHFEYVFEKLFDAGALDVYMSHLIMKKNRPGILLSVVAKKDDVEKLSQIIFSETTSLGVRFYFTARKVQARSFHKVKTPFGQVTVKAASNHAQAITNIMPEYEDCRRLARQKNQPLKDLYQEAQRAAYKEIHQRRMKK